jgi:hypothetical protein
MTPATTAAQRTRFTKGRSRPPNSWRGRWSSFVVPVIFIILLARLRVDASSSPGAGSDGMEAERVAERLKPVGTVESQGDSRYGPP